MLVSLVWDLIAAGLKHGRTGACDFLKAFVCGPIKTKACSRISTKEKMWISKMLSTTDHPYITGKGGRYENNNLRKMQGLNIKSLRHHVALQPLFAMLGCGLLFVATWVGRLATKSDDINWSKEKDWSTVASYYEGKQLKMLNPGKTDFTAASASRPKYE